MKDSESSLRERVRNHALPTGIIVSLFAAIAALYANVVTKGFILDAAYSMYPDVHNHYWMQAFFDKSLFSRDPLVSSHMTHGSPWMILGGVCVTSLLMRLHPYTNGFLALSVLTCAIATYLFWRLADRSAAKPVAASAAVLFAPYFLSKDTFFGVPRAYGAMIFLAFLWAAESGRYLILPAFTAACALIYPPLSPSLAVSSALALWIARAEFSRRKILPRCAAAILVPAALCLAVLWHSPSAGGALQGFSSRATFEDYKLYQFVASPIDPRSFKEMILYFFLNLNEHAFIYRLTSALLVLLFILGLLSDRSSPTMIPRSVRLVLAGSSVAFLALYPIHPVSASRQTVFILPISLVFLAAEGAHRLAGGRQRPALLAAASAAVLAALHPWLNEIISVRHYSAAYDYISTLRNVVVLAGHPRSGLTETIPIFCRKSVLLADDQRDQHGLFVAGGGSAFAAKRKALLSALYSDSPKKACELRLSYGVDYLVLEDRYYDEAYLAMLARSKFPMDMGIARIIADSPNPRGFYHYARRRASFTWKNGRSSGAIFDLSGCAERSAAPRRA